MLMVTRGHNGRMRGKNVRGQVLLEFILLLSFMVFFSWGLLALANGRIENMWLGIANKLTGPSNQPRKALNIR